MMEPTKRNHIIPRLLTRIVRKTTHAADGRFYLKPVSRTGAQVLSTTKRCIDHGLILYRLGYHASRVNEEGAGGSPYLDRRC